jgi:hypothetical protein
MKAKLSTAGWVIAAALGLAAIDGSAHAAVAKVDPVRVQALIARIEAALANLGSTATEQQDATAVQAAIAAFAATPAEAEAALAVVQTSPALTPAAQTAVAAVNTNIQIALNGTSPAAGPAGGVGGAAPIGAPPAYAGGGGSNYVTP